MAKGLHDNSLVCRLESVETVYPGLSLKAIMGWIHMIEWDLALFTIYGHILNGSGYYIVA